MTALMWFRRDLRLGDNPAWTAATADSEGVVALFVVDPRLWDTSGVHRRVQLAAHLTALDARLQHLGGRLLVRSGEPEAVVTEVARGCSSVHWNDDYSPFARRRDDAIEAKLTGQGIAVERHAGVVVHHPESFSTTADDPYKVFTPYSKKWLAVEVPEPGEPHDVPVADDPGDGVPAVDGEPLMEGGEAAALERLAEFVERADRYPEVRNRPDLDETSRLSADLKFGTLSAARMARELGRSSDGRRAVVRQLCWRDFYFQLMYHFPHTATRSMRPAYDSMEWRDDPEGLAAWKEGLTGYPIVDAGMRQLREEGWLHNRVRMIVASFLVKDLLIDWRLGERHFFELLVDGDTAQNIGNWQWVAGTGADAAPYFRIFNPVSQSKKFDPDGTYIRRYVAELAEVPAAAIHEPWEAPDALRAAGVTLGKDYPLPIVDHAMARERTLAAYESAREEDEAGD